MKSIKIKLNQSNPAKLQKLLAIFEVLALVSKEYLLLRQKELESKTYKPFKDHYNYFRTKYPIINSGILQSHLRQQDSMIRSFIAWCKKKHKLVKFPEKSKVSIQLRSDMYHFEYNQTTKTFNAWLKFLKTYYPLNLCEYHKGALSNFESVSDSSIIKDKQGNLFLRLCFETKKAILDSTKTLGIDLGIVKPIVCSDWHMIGSGGFIKHKKIEFGKKRARHQKLKDAITQKQFRWTDDVNHKLSRELVDYCLSQGVGVLGLEKLEGNHLSNRKFRKYTWAFKDLINKVVYKALNAGLKVVSVDPRYTSQTCSSCGQKDKTNRQTQSDFMCRYCNHKANADINAAKNIYNLTVADGLNMNPTIGKALILETQPSLVVG
jgi:IS605 OrfB family transposase